MYAEYFAHSAKSAFNELNSFRKAIQVRGNRAGSTLRSDERSNTFVQIRCDIFSEISMPFRRNLKIEIWN